MTNEKALPEVGEVVISTVKEITPHGIYVTLDEYGGITGFLHISEVSTGWVRNLDRIAKPQQKMVLKVIRSDKNRMEVDLSLRQVSNEERRQKIIEWKREQRANGMLQIVKNRLGISDEMAVNYKRVLEEKYGALYDAFESMVVDGEKALEGLDISPEVQRVMVEVAREKIVPPKYEIGALVELSSRSPFGIEYIKKALANASELHPENVRITYAGAPWYRVRVVADDYKRAEKILNSVLEKIKQGIGKNGTFSFKREMSRKHSELS